MEENFKIESWITGKIIKYKNKTIFSRLEVSEVFEKLTDEQKEEFRMVNQDD